MEYIFKMNNVELIFNDDVFQRLKMYRQYHRLSMESGGLLIGRTNIEGTTRLYEITEPMKSDIRGRIFFRRKDKEHLEYLSKANERCLYFKGNWHTHPQNIPTPSWLDKKSWKNAIVNSKPGESEYIFFIIVGITETRVWCGNMKTSEIYEMKY